MKNVCRCVMYIALIILVSCKKDVKIYEGLDFEEVKKIAVKHNQNFCIVISDLECDGCFVYDNLLKSEYKDLGKKAIFNIVKTNYTENKWYKFWLYTPAVPTTCIFDSYGNLKSIVSGASIKSFQAIERSIDGNENEKEAFYNSPLSDNMDREDTFLILNDILKCKLALDKGEDISQQIDETLNKVWYPFNVYLDYLNESNKGNEENAKYIAKQLLTFKNNNYCNYLYPDLFLEADKILEATQPLDNTINQTHKH